MNQTAVCQARRFFLSVGDVQFKLESYSVPNSGYSSPQSGVAAKKKVLNRSKSCGEGRGKAPPHGLVENKVVVGEKGHNHKEMEKASKTENGGKARRFSLRCGALCLLLPGFGKGKGERKEEAEAECISITISKRVSLEKFECGSWASSDMVVHENSVGESSTGSLYFDLPMELIRDSMGAQTQSKSPVKAAFVWTKPKLTEGSGSSSPTPCLITPRLRKAREEFNALLEAHAHTV